MKLLDDVLTKAIPEFLRLRPRGAQLPEIVKAFRSWDKSLDKKRLYSVLFDLTTMPICTRGKPGRHESTKHIAMLVDQLYQPQKLAGRVVWKDIAKHFAELYPAEATALTANNKQSLRPLLIQAHRRWCRPGNRRAKSAPHFSPRG
jgi:hypothetical protein